MTGKNSVKDKIYSILIQKRLIVPDIKKELSERYEIDISESDVRVYLKRLFDKNKIKKLERDGRYVIYSAIEKESNDSIKINKLKQVLRVYDKLFRDNIDYVMNNEKMSQFIQDHEDFDLIGVVL